MDSYFVDEEPANCLTDNQVVGVRHGFNHNEGFAAGWRQGSGMVKTIAGLSWAARGSGRLPHDPLLAESSQRC